MEEILLKYQAIEDWQTAILKIQNAIQNISENQVKENNKAINTPKYLKNLIEF